MEEMSREERAFWNNPTAVAEAQAALRGEGLIEATEARPASVAESGGRRPAPLNDAQMDRLLRETSTENDEGRLPLAGERVTGDALRAELGLEAEEAEVLAERIEYQHAHPEEAQPLKPRTRRDER